MCKTCAAKCAQKPGEDVCQGLDAKAKTRACHAAAMLTAHLCAAPKSARPGRGHASLNPGLCWLRPHVWCTAPCSAPPPLPCIIANDLRPLTRWGVTVAPPPHLTPTAGKGQQTALEAALKAEAIVTLAPPTTRGNITYDANITDSGASGFEPVRAFTLLLPGIVALASC